jgi:hypothetical protein
MDSRILKSTAVQIPFTAKPSINLSASRIINALIISKNNPNVKTVIGSVRIISIGLTKRFNIESTIATIIAPV